MRPGTHSTSVKTPAAPVVGAVPVMSPPHRSLSVPLGLVMVPVLVIVPVLSNSPYWATSVENSNGLPWTSDGTGVGEGALVVEVGDVEVGVAEVLEPAGGATPPACPG